MFGRAMSLNLANIERGHSTQRDPEGASSTSGVTTEPGRCVSLPRHMRRRCTGSSFRASPRRPPGGGESR